MNAPTASSGFHFPESLGRANGTLGANAYTPFIIPPTAEGGGAGDWTFSSTGYTTEAWVFPFGADISFFIAGQNAGNSSANFTRASTNLVHIAGNDWGGEGKGWNKNGSGERFWHFVATVWTPAGSADPSALYGTSGSSCRILKEQTWNSGTGTTVNVYLRHPIDWWHYDTKLLFALKVPPSMHGVVIDKKLFARVIRDRKARAKETHSNEPLKTGILMLGLRPICSKHSSR